MKNVLVTGAAGKLGSEVCKLLVESGYGVKATDILRRNDLSYKILFVDLLDRAACYNLVDDIDSVVHCAAHPNANSRDAQTTYIENVTMTMNLVQAGVESGMKEFIYASSIQAAAQVPNRFHEPSDPLCTLPYLPADGALPANPNSTYGLSKQACEEMLRFYTKTAGISCTALRFPNLANFEMLLQHLSHWRQSRHDRLVYLDECFAYLSTKDAARLIHAILEAQLRGFRIYLPAAQSNKLGLPPSELIDEYYQSIPLRKPAKELTGLVDIEKITDETGWRPVDELSPAQSVG